MEVPFNRPLILGTEQAALNKVFKSGKFAGNGEHGAKCQVALEDKLAVGKTLLTTSCTSALELACILLDIGPGDEVIIPSYAFVTTANAFASRGVKVVFADSKEESPCIDESLVEALITQNTKAIVALHYAGIACDMDVLNTIAKKHGVAIIEDNAQGLAATYKGRALGTVGTVGALSFHETKNIHCGEGGALCLNSKDLYQRADKVWDMGTNRDDFKAGRVNSYGWVDIGSSFYPSELNAAFLLEQLAHLEEVYQRRLSLWDQYHDQLGVLETTGVAALPSVPTYAKHNGHTFYLTCGSETDRNALIAYLGKNGVNATFHFQSLHRSDFFKDKHTGNELPNSDRFSQCLVRLPLYYNLTEQEQNYVVKRVKQFYTH